MLRDKSIKMQALMEPHLLVAAVEPPGDLAEFGRVLRQLGVEQHERDVADPEDPRREVSSRSLRRIEQMTSLPSASRPRTTGRLWISEMG